MDSYCNANVYQSASTYEATGGVDVNMASAHRLNSTMQQKWLPDHKSNEAEPRYHHLRKLPSKTGEQRNDQAVLGRF